MTQISDLKADERLALIALAKAIVQADREFSRGEQKELEQIAAEMGEGLFVETTRLAQKRFRELGELQAFVGQITRQAARDLIYDQVYEIAKHDDILEAEKRVLGWLAVLWSIQVDPETLAPRRQQAPPGR
jgi:uncharacterized tellurite resistance protein B-like protein